MPSYSKTVQVKGKSPHELYTVVSVEIEGFLQKTPLKEYKLHRDEGKKQIKIESSFMNATLHCEIDTLRLEGSLSFLAMPFKSKLDEGIEKWVKKTFNLA